MTIPDKDLVQRTQAGCSESFRALVERHQRGVFNVLCRRLRNQADAEDVCQETFLRAWHGIARYSPSWEFSTWLYSIAVRASVDWLRKRREVLSADQLGETQPTPQRDIVDGAKGPQETVAGIEQARTLWSLADQVLSEDQRTALWLRYAEDRDVKDIGSVLARSSLAVRLLLMRARRKLASHITSETPASIAPHSASSAVQTAVVPLGGHRNDQ